MTPWKVAVGLTAAAGGVGVWVLWGAVSYLHEYTRLVMDVHGAYLLVYGTAALLTVGAGAGADGSRRDSHGVPYRL